MCYVLAYSACINALLIVEQYVCYVLAYSEWINALLIVEQ